MKQISTTLRRLLMAVAVSAAATSGGPAMAAYPDKPINMIVAYAPGGGSDLVVRLLAPFLEKEMGVSARIVVINRPGAGGAIGFTELANAAPDGYTIGLINTPNVLTIPIERKTTFTWQSYDLLGNVVDDPGNFSVHAENPIKSLAELASYAKSHPGEVSVGTTGIGSDDHLAMIMFGRAVGARLNHIPFKGAAEVRSAIQGNQITVAAMNADVLEMQRGRLFTQDCEQGLDLRFPCKGPLPGQHFIENHTERINIRPIVDAAGQSTSGAWRSSNARSLRGPR